MVHSCEVPSTGSYCASVDVCEQAGLVVAL